MTAQLLTTELTNLIQESKRKNSDLRSAAEKSLQDLKSFHATSEEQLAVDLIRRPQFIQPFLISCGTQNARFAGPAIVCLQRLSVVHGLPKERLKDVLEAFRECTSLNLDIQLKILQSLPSLLQNYSNELRGELLLSILAVCSSLQAAKHPAVSGSAVATLQQLVIYVFDKVVDEDEKSLDIPCKNEVPGNDGAVQIRAAAYDAYKVFHDLCLIAEGLQPKYAKLSLVSSASGLELIESILTNHGAIFDTHDEQAHILCTLAMPLVTKGLSERSAFQITVRSLRILQILVRNHLRILSKECESALLLVTSMLDETNAPWRRALVLEFFRSIFTEPVLIAQVYRLCDQKDSGRGILQDFLGSLVRLSTEKPSAIGLGQTSTTPVVRSEHQDGSAEQAAIEAGAMAGLISGPAVSTNSTGLTAQWSTVKVAYIDLLDKVDPPVLPETYLYSLVIACINNLSDSMAKFIIPLTVHTEPRQRRRKKAEEATEEQTPEQHVEGAPNQRRLTRTQSFRKRTVPINPLTLEGHNSFPLIHSASELISTCWPAVLATCSTFLNASLDNDYYRALVRSIQRFTQVAGLLRLKTPRDAFLTTLGKNAVPSKVLTASLTSPKIAQSEFGGTQASKSMLSVESIVSQASFRPSDRNRTQDESDTMLNARNLLCLRALLNLAIALGPTLESSWSIVFENLHQADIILAVASGKTTARVPREVNGRSKTQPEIAPQDVSSEAAAVQAAASRLFESTVDFPNDAFVHVLQSLCALLHSIPASFRLSGPPTPTSPGMRMNHQRRVGSVSSLNMVDSNAQDYLFALSKVGDLAAMNLPRFAHYDISDSGWKLLAAELHALATDIQIPAKARCMGAEILGQVGRDIAKLSLEEEEDTRINVQKTILQALKSLVEALYKPQQRDLSEQNESATEVHDIALASLKAMLEQCGDSISVGWDLVFDILTSVFYMPEGSSDTELSAQVAYRHHSVRSKGLARSAFGSVQLICSDFLAAIPLASLNTLLDLVLRFSSQEEDLNMSLTTVTFFWNVADFLASQDLIITFKDLASIDPTMPVFRIAVRETAAAGSVEGLWLLVLLHLSLITSSSRIELRNGAVQTIIRIFQSSDESLSASTWHVCIQAVLFEMLRENIHAQQQLHQDADVERIHGWNETSKLMLESMATLIASHFDEVKQSPQFTNLWSALLDLWTSMLRIHSHSLNAAAYLSMSILFSKVEVSAHRGLNTAEQALGIWIEHFPQETREQETSDGNQEAFLAYIGALASVYPLVKPNISEGANAQVTPNLQRLIEASLAMPYASDIESLTPLQKQVIDVLDGIRTDLAGSSSACIEILATFVTLPFRRANNELAVHGPRFVALSRASMTAVATMLKQRVSTQEIYTSGAVQTVLLSLARAIEQKYKWKLEAKSHRIWQVATRCALDILAPMLKHLTLSNIDKELQKYIWQCIVDIGRNIASATVEEAKADESLVKDEEFDVSALNDLQSLIIPALGSAFIPDTFRREYTLALFRSSMIHAAEPGEIYEEGPLMKLYTIRFGRTYEPTPTARTKMAFFCLSQLVDLVAAHKGTPEQVRLAQAAAPYLILRAALPLRSYIADQPLRSRMPQPESERQELLFVLKEMAVLESEPKAIPDAPGVVSENKRHLFRLYPLLLKASRIAMRDNEVREALLGCIEALGDEFGI